MFELFRNIFPLRVSVETVDLLIVCLRGIHDKHVSLAVPQLEAGLLRYWREDNVREPNYVSFTYFPNISSRFEDPYGRSFRIKGIFTGSKDGNSETWITIYFSRGLICGYAFESDRDFDPDLTTIDTSAARLEFLDTPDLKLEELIEPKNSELINWSDVFEVEIDGVVYFHLKDIDDGDFIGIDAKRNLYEIRHDPFEIKRLSGNLRDILGFDEGSWPP